MTHRLRMACLAALAALLSAGAVRAQVPEPSCRASLEPWTQVELYFGRGVGGGLVVSDAAWRQFLAQEVTPRFPDGLTVVDAAGQWHDADGEIVREPTKLLILLVPDAEAIETEIDDIIDAYKERYQQESVLYSEHPVCIAF
ncbi:MAG: DUF3574 domain-containing protein [Rhodospirillaceae bacterium]|nr:DUF3574 domain-containing protein [Rhodospirillaceae bacterium]